MRELSERIKVPCAPEELVEGVYLFDMYLDEGREKMLIFSG
ncbi:hypothetical protein [Lentibacillus songyuanensis]